MMTSIQKIKNFFSSPTVPVNLGYVRFFYISAMLIWLRFHLLEYASLSHDFWFPNGVFHLTPFFASPFQHANILYYAYYFFGLLAAVGALTRWTLPVFAFLSVFCLGYDYNFGVGGAAKAPLVMVLLILAFSRAGDYFSIDCLLQKSRIDRDALSWEYRWPIRSAQVFYVFAWTSAGLQKIFLGGWFWLSGRYLQSLLSMNDWPLLQMLGQNQVLCAVASWIVIWFELFSFLIFSKKIGRYMMLAEIGFLILMNIILKVHIYQWSLMLLFFIDYRSMDVTFSRWIEKARRYLFSAASSR